MRTWLPLAACLLLSTSTVAAPGPAKPDAKPSLPPKARLTVAVAPFVSPSSLEYHWIGLGIAHALVSQLLELKDVNTLTVRQLNSALRKDNLRPEELNDEKVAEHLGVQLGADVIVIGSYTAEWPETTIVARAYSLKDHKVTRSIFATGNLEDFFALEGQVARELFQLLGLKGEPGLAPVGTKNIYAFHQAMLGLDLINWQSMSPHNAVTLPQGNLKKARLHFERAAKIDPKYPEAYAGMGQADAFLGEYDAARKSFGQAFQLAPSGFQAQAVLGKYFCDLHSGRTDEALRGLDQGQKARPGFLHALGYLGETYNHMGRHREALQIFERYHLVAPKQPWVLIQLGYTKAKLKRFDDAIKDTEQAVGMLPESASFRTELASRYIDADRLPAAEDVLRKALVSDPKNAKMHLRLGYIYLLQKKLDPAASELDKALSEAQLSQEKRVGQLAHFDLARVMVLKKDFKGALSHLDEAVKSGFRDLEDLESDPDFDALRKDPKFLQIVSAAKKPAA